MEFLYQIKLATSEYNPFNRPVLANGIIERDSKKEVLDFIEKEYPEYFDGNKVSQKLSKKSEQLVYVTIHELDDYWKNYWKQEMECDVCHKKVPLIQVKNQLGSLSHFICSAKCEEELEKRRAEAGDEFWNDRCSFYYIYKITNKVDGKVYVGYTEREPIFRWWEHFKHSQLPIGQALKEQGIENFTFEVLEKHSKNEKSIEEMHAIETRYISEFDSILNGYNCMVSKRSDYDYCGELVFPEE